MMLILWTIAAGILGIIVPDCIMLIFKIRMDWWYKSALFLVGLLTGYTIFTYLT